MYTEMELPKKNFVDNNKYNHQATMPVLNWLHRSTNITTVEVLIVLYSDCGVNSERQNLITHDSNVFVIRCVA